MRVATIALCVLAASTATSRAASITLPHCLVSLIEETQVPAEEAGVLLHLDVKEGYQVKTGQLLAQIDDTQAKMQLQVAGFNLAVAKEQAENDVNVRYATAASEVAKAKYEKNVRANRKVPGTKSEIELRELRLDYRRLVLQIEQARMELRIAALEARVKEAEVEASKENLDRRRIKSPLDGMVVELYRHSGEWVQPGDPVMHIVRVDRLRVEGFLNAIEIAPNEVDGRPVTVRVNLAHGRAEQFTGKVIFVSPLVQAGGEYQVWAEAENKQEGGHWLLRPGLSADMTIQLKPALSRK